MGWERVASALVVADGDCGLVFDAPVVLRERMGIGVLGGQAGRGEQARDGGDRQSDHRSGGRGHAFCGADGWPGVGGLGCGAFDRDRFAHVVEVVGALDGEEGVGKHDAGDPSVPGTRSPAG